MTAAAAVVVGQSVQDSGLTLSEEKEGGEVGIVARGQHLIAAAVGACVGRNFYELPPSSGEGGGAWHFLDSLSLIFHAACGG